MKKTVKDIEIPEYAHDEGVALQELLIKHSNDLRKYCQKTIGKLRGPKFINRNIHMNVWLETSLESLKGIYDEFDKLTEETSKVIKACDKLKKKIPLEQTQKALLDA